MLKNRKNVRKIKNIVTILVALVMVLGIYIKVQAIDSGPGTINPIYKPEWEKVSSTIDTANQSISIVLKGTAVESQTINDDVSINYSSTVSSSLETSDILVYIDGELDGDTNKNGVLDAGETPSITKAITPVAPIEGVSAVTQTLTLSGFGETLRQDGKPYKEWSGNIKVKIKGRGKDASTYSEDVLIDVYGNQNMMETDQDGTNADGSWKDIVFGDANSTTNTNTSGTMFTDFIKPEFTYVHSAQTTNINNETETVTVVFDVIDKYFNSTTLSNLDASQIKIHFDDYDVTELNNILDTNNHKQLTKKTIAEDETTANGVTYKTDGSIWYTVNGTSKKIGERYQLVVTGLDQEDAFKYSGYMTLSFDAGTITDQAGNTSDATSITVGKNEPNTPYLPEGYSYVEGNLSTGLVIQDSNGNQFVWVEVPRTELVYKTAGLNITEFTDDDYEKIEDDLQEYTTVYRNGTSYEDEWASATGMSEDEYNTQKKKMLKSIYRNGGFYVGRYETGTETARSANTDALTTPLIKQNVYPYNWVTQAQAQTLAQRFTTTGYTGSLMFGVQWDLVLRYLETKGATQAELNSNSTAWGNFFNTKFSIDASSSWGNKDTGEWLSGPYEKNNNGCIILSTGASELFKKQNIYDLAGNIKEATLEYSGVTSSPGIRRGGGSYSYGLWTAEDGDGPVSNRSRMADAASLTRLPYSPIQRRRDRSKCRNIRS